MQQRNFLINFFGWLLIVDSSTGSLFGIVGMYSTFHDMPVTSLLIILAMGLLLAAPGILLGLFVLKKHKIAILLGLIYSVLQLVVYKSASVKYSTIIGAAYLKNSGIENLQINLVAVPLLISGFIALHQAKNIGANNA